MLRSLSLLAIAVALPVVTTQTSTISDPLGDTLFAFNPPYQDVVHAQMTKTASGDYDMLMEMAAPVPADPSMPQAHNEMWWIWIFDDVTTSPIGYPFLDNPNYEMPPEFMVIVRWNGTEFAGTAIDRRPLLTGGEAVITPVPFSINGTTIEAHLASEVIGPIPTFLWAAFTMDWSGPIGTDARKFADYAFEAGTIVNP